MQNDKSDLVVVFVVTRGTRWMDPVNDPLYSAHKTAGQRMTNNKTYTYYVPDSPASAFGCQYQARLPIHIVRQALTSVTVSILLFSKIAERQLYRPRGSTNVMGFPRHEQHSTSAAEAASKDCVYKLG